MTDLLPAKDIQEVSDALSSGFKAIDLNSPSHLKGISSTNLGSALHIIAEITNTLGLQEKVIKAATQHDTQAVLQATNIHTAEDQQRLQEFVEAQNRPQPSNK